MTFHKYITLYMNKGYNGVNIVHRLEIPVVFSEIVPWKEMVMRDYKIR